MAGRRRLRSYTASATDTTITSNSNLPPPTSGTYDYNNFTPPAKGSSYVDPVFNKTVIRLSNIGNTGSEDGNYTYHYINADGTLFFHKEPGVGVQVCSTTTGNSVYSGANVPTGLSFQEIRWSMTDPNSYYFFENSALKKRDLVAGTTTTIKTFAATLQAMGNSHSYTDKTNRYFVVMYSNTAKVWDSQTDTIYANPIAPLPDTSNPTVTISPSGNHILTWASTDAMPNKLHYAYPINHGTQSISATPVHFWGIGTSHGVVVSASDGKDYWVGPEAYGTAGVWRCDVTISVAGMTDSQQRAAQAQILDIGFNDDNHYTGVTVGTKQDWVFVSTEANDDDFDEAVGAWRKYKQEIIAINVLTSGRRRLAHHRSRQLDGSRYYPQPKVSCSPTGNFCLWTSNMNLNQATTEYGDLYGIANPLTSL